MKIVSSVKTFQHRAPSSKRAAWARTRAAAYRARQDSSYLSVEDQYPLSFQPRSRRSSRPRSPISRSVSPTSRTSFHLQGELDGGRNYRSSSPLSVGLREDPEPRLMVGVFSVTLKKNWREGEAGFSKKGGSRFKLMEVKFNKISTSHHRQRKNVAETSLPLSAVIPPFLY